MLTLEVKFFAEVGVYVEDGELVPAIPGWSSGEVAGGVDDSPIWASGGHVIVVVLL